MKHVARPFLSVIMVGAASGAIIVLMAVLIGHFVIVWLTGQYIDLSNTWLGILAMSGAVLGGLLSALLGSTEMRTRRGCALPALTGFGFAVLVVEIARYLFVVGTFGYYSDKLASRYAGHVVLAVILVGVTAAVVIWTFTRDENPGGK